MMKLNKPIRYLRPSVQILYPKSSEREYYRLLRAMVKMLNKLSLENIEPLKDVLRYDSTDSEHISGKVLEELEVSGVKAEVMSGIKRVMKGVDNTAKDNLRRSYRSCLQVDVFINDPGDTGLLEAVTSEWYSQQSQHVNSIVSNYTDKLATIVSNAVQRGSLYKDVQKEVKDLYNITDNRAKFIVRNEIGNLNAVTTKKRQEEAGIYCYEWRTSEDERVRASHAELNENLFFWHDSKVGEINGRKIYPAPKFHPGMDYNCRCVAIPIIDTQKWNMGAVTPLGQPKPQGSKELLVLKSGKKGDTDGHSVIDYVGDVEYNDNKVVEQYFAYFAKKMVDEKVEKALVITAGNRLYQLTGSSGAVNITLVGEAALKGAKIIHNHPASYGVFGDAFSREDFIGMFTYGISTLEVVSGLGRFRLRYQGKILSVAEANRIYLEAQRHVTNQAIMHGQTMEYVQLATMEHLRKILPGIIFERI